ncbi:hypothetical protein D6D19_05423 [Aureobasidium pullulans]|uniref:Uncharacterized protein n=1 Tax=Aureobasidium pullulans TaxID=5580 RepID=A0A4S9A453_AURPU|nr:hypothetical protein D6D19_05423 [Aureobasidium pullulans]
MTATTDQSVATKVYITRLPEYTRALTSSQEAFDPVDVAAVRYIDVEDESSDDEAFLDELVGEVSSDEEEVMDDETGDLITTKKSSAESKGDVHARIVESVKQSEDYVKIKNTFHEKLSTITVKYGADSENAHESTDEQIQKKESTIGVEDETDTVTNDISSGDKYALVIADEHETREDVKANHMQQIWKIAEAGTESEWLSDGEPYRRKLDGKDVWVVNIVEKALIQKKLEKKKALEAKGMDVAVWNRFQDALKMNDEATIEELQELYKGFNIEDGASGGAPAMPQTVGGASAEPKDKKRVLPEKIAEVGEYCRGT